MRDSSATHIRFDPDVAVRDTQDTPFAKTMKHFKQFKGKENMPSKSRRNASLPDEIAELAKAAQQDGIENEQEMWKAYREIDFAPEDPVMDAGLAGDLIMAGTPTKQRITAPLEHVKSVTPTLNDGQVSRTPIGDAGTVYEVSIPGHYDDAFRLRFRSKSSIQRIASFIRKRGEELEANEKDIDHVVKVGSRIIHDCDPSCIYLAARNGRVSRLTSAHSYLSRALGTSLSMKNLVVRFPTVALPEASMILKSIRFLPANQTKTYPYRQRKRRLWAATVV